MYTFHSLKFIAKVHINCDFCHGNYDCHNMMCFCFHFCSAVVDVATSRIHKSLYKSYS